MRRALLLLALLCAGCAREGDPVRALIDGAARDADRRDAAALVARLAADFSAGDGEDRAAMELTLKRLFLAYGSVSVRLSDVTIERSPDAARAAFRADFSGTPREAGLAGFLPRSAAYRFDLRAVRDGGAWKIARAEWRPLPEGP